MIARQRGTRMNWRVDNLRVAEHHHRRSSARLSCNCLLSQGLSPLKRRLWREDLPDVQIRVRGTCPLLRDHCDRFSLSAPCPKNLVIDEQSVIRYVKVQRRRA